MDVSQSTLSGVFASRYTVEGVLGHGATSTVYRARDIRTDRPVAIKVLRRELAEALGADRFLREIKLTLSLHHPRILPVLDSGQCDGRLYFVAPFMDGGTLRQRLEREHQLPLADAIQITITIADALAHAHVQGFIHRDVKPDNILFANGEVCLADFGIARAIERSVDDVSTSTGIARGTPAYMSPEQASGARDYDGRSDIYSLGCVLYEMITGMRPFLGPTAQAVISQRFLHPPRPLAVYRPSVPLELQKIVSRALEVSPADRYRTASELTTALTAIPQSELLNAERHHSGIRSFLSTPERRIAVGAGIGIVVVAMALASKSSLVGSAASKAVDTTRIVVVPFEGSASRGAVWRDDDLMHDALARWRGLHVVDEFQVADALRRTGTIESTASAEKLARTLGAGRYVRGRLTGSGDKWRADAVLYEVGSPRPLYTAMQPLQGLPQDAIAAYERLADSLLLRGSGADDPAPNRRRSESLPSIQAFGRAQDALDQWDLVAADSGFQRATAFDPDYARASLWLAQVRAWRGQPPQTWTVLGERALALSAQLNERERQLAAALVFLGHAQYTQACDVYARLKTRNDRDFAAWFGLGQCRTMDNTVVADKASPSGWRFRGSVSKGMDAYAKAFEILPSVHRGYERGAFEQLRRLLLVSTNIRPGFRLPDSAAYYGRLGLVGDSIVMIAYPWQMLFSGDPASFPPGFDKALARRRADFLRIASGWSAAYPQNASAKQAVGVALELLGDASAIDTLHLARRLESDSSRELKLAAAEVILLIKFGLPDNLPRLKQARALADSLFSRVVDNGRAEGAVLAPVAALFGRCASLDDMVRSATSAQADGQLPLPLASDANVLTTRIATGCSVGSKSLHSLAVEIEQSVGRSSAQHQRTEQMLLYRAVALDPRMDPAVTDHLSAATSDDLLLAARAVAHGEIAAARAHLAAVDDRAGTPTPDITLARARLWRRVGDARRAERLLDSALASVVSFDPQVLTDPVNAGALVSMIHERAELTASNPIAAKRWVSALNIVWSSADPDVKAKLATLPR